MSAERYEAQIDSLYEEALKLCRRVGHIFTAFWMPSGELLVCERCEAVFREEEV